MKTHLVGCDRGRGLSLQLSFYIYMKYQFTNWLAKRPYSANCIIQLLILTCLDETFTRTSRGRINRDMITMTKIY